MNKKILSLFLLIFLVVLISNVNAEQEQSLGFATLNDCVIVKQTCATCSFVNFTSSLYPNKTHLETFNTAMTQSGVDWYTTYCNTTRVGEFIFSGFGDPNGELKSWTFNLMVNEEGIIPSIYQIILIIAELGIVFLFSFLGYVFDQKRWMVKTFFYLCALLIAIITLNTARLIVAGAEGLSKMSEIALILAIVVSSIMFLYMFIYAFLQAIKVLKNKKEMTWNSDI